MAERRSKMNQINFRIGRYLFGALACFGTLSLFWSPPLGLALFGINAIYIGTCLHEVKSPDMAFLFRMGRFVGRLEPGWFLTIPHLWQISIIPTSWQEFDIKGEEMYTKESTSIVVKGKGFYRADEKKAEDILRMMPKEMINRAMTVGRAVLRGEIGSHSFGELIKEKGTLENAALLRLTEEFASYGYIIRDFEIYDFDEKVWSEAERTKALGKARGEAAKALSEPLKDNYPAALVSSIGTIAETAEKIAKTISGKEKLGTKSSGSIRSEETKDVGQKIAEAINKLI